MREESTNKNSYGTSRTGRTNINMEGQNAGDEGETSESCGVPDCSVRNGDILWTMRKHDRRKIDAFELWCWRRVPTESIVDGEKDQHIWIIENIKPEWILQFFIGLTTMKI